jgi:hypothetical protein
MSPSKLCGEPVARQKGAFLGCTPAALLPCGRATESPWQNGVAERWVRSFRNELLDHVIVLDESHLRRLAQDYLRYYHQDRTHDGLN